MPRPVLTPLSLPHPSSSSLSSSTPAGSPLPSPLTPSHSERRPLLRSVASLTPAKLKRTSAHLGDYLGFNHHEPTPSGAAPLFCSARNDQHDTDTLASPRSMSRSRNSIFGGASLRRITTRPSGYDGAFLKEFEGEGGNGVRTWYDNYQGIDWIHDAIKHSVRLRRLRSRKRTDGLRGRLANLWDGFQGWLLVSLIGISTALIAHCIISSEMVLFDLKEGYCTKGWTVAKRFCCPRRPTPTRPSVPNGAFVLSGRGSAMGGEGEETCEIWKTWAQVWEARTGEGEGAGELFGYLAYGLVALAFATLASTLTIYLTSSTSVYSSKDSPSIPHLELATPELTSSSKYGAVYDSAVHESAPPDIPVLKQRPRKTLYFAAGSGIPEIKTILSGFVIRGYLGSWTLGVKAVGLALSVASGLSLGKEGPFVHIASCVGNIISRFFPKYDRNEAKRREILSAACAAGVAVSFGAPVGGVLFSLEEVSYFFPPRTMLRSFWCAMTAAISLKLLDPFRNGKIVLFEVTYDRDWHALELVGFLFLAVFGGVYGALFCKANISWTKHVRNGTRLGKHPIVEVALVTLATALISHLSPFTTIGGTELISSLFSECHLRDSPSLLCVSSPSAAWSLISSIFLALCIKAALTVITFGIKLPAGIFIPTLAVGACAGRIAGLLVEVAHARWPTAAVFEVCRPSGGEGGPLPFGQACVLPGVWAMIGAASTLAGVTRTTVSLAVIVFELTGTLTYSVPTMLAVLVAKTVADSIEPRSIYDLVIEVADLPFLDAKAEYLHDFTPADILDSTCPTISLDDSDSSHQTGPNTVSSLRAKLAALYADGTASGFPIVAIDESEPSTSSLSRSQQPPRRVYGYIAAKELEHGLALATARGLGEDAAITFKTASAAAKGLLSAAAGGGGRGTAMQSGAVTPTFRDNGGGVVGGALESMDLGWLSDSAPITVSVRSSIELLHEMFIKLGLRGVLIVDERGLFLGSVEKNRYLRYLQWLEKRNEHGGAQGRKEEEGGGRGGLERVLEREDGEEGATRRRERRRRLESC